MSDTPCDQLDDYLDGVLPLETAREFEEHLRVCDQCCRAVDFERLVTTAARDQAEHIAAPIEVVDGTRRAIRRQANQWRFVWTPGLGAAILVACLLVYSQGFRRVATDPLPHSMRNEPTVPSPPSVNEPRLDGLGDPPESIVEAKRAATVRVRSGHRQSHIAVTRSSSTDNVTIVMMYPTIDRNAEPSRDGSEGE